MSLAAAVLIMLCYASNSLSGLVVHNSAVSSATNQASNLSVIVLSCKDMHVSSQHGAHQGRENEIEDSCCHHNT